MRKNLLSQKTPHNNKFKPTKLGMKKTGKFCIGFLWVYLIPWLCIFKMQNHPSKLGVHWWRCIAPIHKPAKCKSNKSYIIYRKIRWTSVTILQRWKPCRCSCIYRSPCKWWRSVVVTLNGLRKNYSQFRTSIVVRETYPDFQDLITLLISEVLQP